VLVSFALSLLTLAASPAETPRLLVLNLEAANTPQEEAKAVDALIVAHAEVDGVVLISQQELRRLAEVDAAAQAAGCDDNGCLAEIAGALGARYVLFGSTSRLGQSVTVSLSLFDADKRVTKRDALTVTRIDDLPTELPPRVQALVRGALDHPPPPVEPAPAVDEGPGLSPLFLAGVATTAVGVLLAAGGGAVAAYAEYQVIQDKDVVAAAKRDAQLYGLAGLYGGVIGGVVLAGAGVGLIVLGSGE
jgi:hypothetical protein